MSVVAVICAAGRGSRLNHGPTKLLVRVTRGDSVWSILRGKLDGLVGKIHVILSPAGVEPFQRTLEKDPPNTPVTIGIQSFPVGTLDAFFCGYPVWSKADSVLALWGDQIHVSRETLQAGIKFHANGKRKIVLPLVRSREPYVEYMFDSAERLTAIRQTREGDRCKPNGWADVGAFLLSTGGLRDERARFLATGMGMAGGSLTGEMNFLPFLVFLARRRWNIRRFRVADPLEARGINTREDLKFFTKLYEGDKK
jgi:bifunctional UDP-N-acetylglucosamine pyrophosphorylase / glucosamine-1-phosphate N-acetyltransferase